LTDVSPKVLSRHLQTHPIKQLSQLFFSIVLMKPVLKFVCL